MTNPNWRTWVPMTYVKVWEACVLSVGLEPSSMEFEDDRWGEHKAGTGPHIERESFPNPEIKKDYKDLIKILTANLLNLENFYVGDINNPQGKGYYTVKLDEFVRWATLNVKWLDLPPELAALALNSSNGNSAESNVVQASDKPIADTQDEPWIEYCKSQTDDIYQSRITSGKAATKRYIADELVGRCRRNNYVTKRNMPVSRDNVLKQVLKNWTEPKIEK